MNIMSFTYNKLWEFYVGKKTLNVNLNEYAVMSTKVVFGIHCLY